MKDRSLCICRYIRDILRENDDVISLVPQKNITALIVNQEETTGPLITIVRNSIEIEYTKDYAHYNTVHFDVNIFGQKYDEVTDIATEVRSALETFHWDSEDFYIRPIRMTGAYESYADTVFTETLSFSCMMT